MLHLANHFPVLPLLCPLQYSMPAPSRFFPLLESLPVLLFGLAILFSVFPEARPLLLAHQGLIHVRFLLPILLLSFWEISSTPTSWTTTTDGSHFYCSILFLYLFYVYFYFSILSYSWHVFWKTYHSWLLISLQHMHVLQCRSLAYTN